MIDDDWAMYIQDADTYSTTLDLEIKYPEMSLEKGLGTCISNTFSSDTLILGQGTALGR